MRLLSCIALLAVSCASLPGSLGGASEGAGAAGERSQPEELRLDFAASAAAGRGLGEGPAVPLEIEAIMTRLAAAQLAFIDPQTLESFRAVGPYRIVSWGQSELKLVGYDADGLGAAHIDVRTEPGSMWVVAQIRDREFLLRVD